MNNYPRTCDTCNKFVSRLDVFCKACGECEQKAWDNLAAKAEKVREAHND